MRTLRIAGPAQQALTGGLPASHREVWAGLPEAASPAAAPLGRGSTSPARPKSLTRFTSVT